MEDILGCDIGKANIDIEWVTESGRRQVRVANEIKAIRKFAHGLPAGCCVGMEATGQYHELFADELHKRGHQVFVINPRWIYMYAKSIGARGKTDRGDAAVVARFLAAEASNLQPYDPPSPAQRELRGLLLRRHELVKLSAATKQSLSVAAKPVVREFTKLIAKIDLRVRALIRADSTWNELDQRLRTEPGIGPLIGAHLVQVLTRFAFRSSDSLVAYTGLDPRPNDSGIKRGRRRLTHQGDRHLRTLLYMAAMTACRSDPQWGAILKAQRAKGLTSTAAYVVVARKLLRIAFTLFRNAASYDPKRLTGG